jgi:eukaryotic-like serine/threonine-protein kinase
VRGIGPGTVLGGRYTVRRRLEQRAGTERWSADDTTLGRGVSVLVVAADDHRTASLLDAARRAASVSHPVLVRILDVGTDLETAYIVEEDVERARNLTSLATGGGVPGDEVRRITGEVATALEAARQRGMHHLDLTPDDILRTEDGDIRLRGLETSGVRAGEDGVDAEDAARRDAVGVVALTYAGLTGLWPLGSGGSGLGLAPKVQGGVAAPSEIAAGVPRDLDALCRLTLNENQGPTSPGDYARQIAPWPTRQVVSRPAAASVPQPDPEPSRAEPSHAGLGVPRPPHPADREAGHGDTDMAAVAGDATTSAVGSRSDGSAPRTPSIGAPGPDASAAGRVPGESGPGAPARVGDTVTGARRSHDTAPSDRLAPSTAHPAPGSTRPMRTLRRPELGDNDIAAEPDLGRRSGGSGAAASANAAGAAVVGALETLGGRVGDFARRTVDKVGDLSPDSIRHDQRPVDVGTGTPRDEVDYPAPLVPAEPLTQDESKLALLIVAGFLVVALVVGIWGVSRIGSNSSFGLGAGSSANPVAPPQPGATPTTSGSGTPTPGATGAPEPLAVLGVGAYDPDGDGEENNELTPKTYDGDLNSGWRSENYRNESFGGLKKGLGLVVDLGPNKKPQQVRLEIPVATDVEVWVGPDARLEGAKKIGEKAGARGSSSFDVPPEVNGQYIIVWFTGLSVDGEGKRRAWLNEVVVTG